MEPRPRTYRLTEAEIEALAERAAEKVLKHFGVTDEKGADDLRIAWSKVTGIVGLYETVSATIGKWLLNAILLAITIILGVAAGIKSGIFGNG